MSYKDLDKADAHILLTIAIKLIRLLGFDLATVISVWNDVEEGKE